MTPQQQKAVTIMHEELDMDAHEIVDNFTNERIHVTLAAVKTEISKRAHLAGNSFLQYRGISRTITEWQKITGISRQTIYRRITEHGWSVKRALETPVKHMRNNRSKYVAKPKGRKTARQKINIRVNHRPSGARLH